MIKKTINRLTKVQVLKDKPRKGFYKISEGGEMYLLMHHNGSKYWRINYPGLREAFSCMFTTPQSEHRLMESKSMVHLYPRLPSPCAIDVNGRIWLALRSLGKGDS